MKMIMDKVMKRFRRKRILNDMKREINKLMGVIGMTMQNMEMVWEEEIKMWSKDKGLSGEELKCDLVGFLIAQGQVVACDP